MAMNRLIIMGDGLLIGAENLRPDLVVLKDNEINIFDVTVALDVAHALDSPLENTLEVF